MKKIIFAICSIVFTNAIHAQDTTTWRWKVSAGIGGSYFWHTSLSDFAGFDYITQMQQRMIDDIYLPVSLHFNINNHWQANVVWKRGEDSENQAYNTSIQYSTNPNWGINVSFYHDYFKMRTAADFHLKQEENLFFISNDILVKNVSLNSYFVGTVWQKKYKRIISIIKLNVGLGKFDLFTEQVYEKQRKSNYRREIEYNPARRYSFFFFPELELNFDCFTRPTGIIGIQLQADCLVSKKDIDYQKTIFEWTWQNVDIEHINAPIHWLYKTNLHIGLYYRFNKL